jgi:hypothetical protein
VSEQLALEWEDATRRAFDALARYKFWMFGYHAARVVYLGSLIHRLGGPKLANPFGAIVQVARDAYCRNCGEMRGTNHLCTSTSLEWAIPTGQLALLGDGACDDCGRTDGTHDTEVEH